MRIKVFSCLFFFYIEEKNKIICLFMQVVLPSNEVTSGKVTKCLTLVKWP